MKPIFWAGSQESFEAVEEARIKVDNILQAGGGAQAFAGMADRLPKMWQHQGNTAVINISGALIQGEAGWMRLFGVVGYDDIAAAAVEAAMDPETKSMLYAIDSPGGDVSGVMDCAALLSQLSSMKPSAVYSSDLCASAGYWLASSIDGKFVAGPTAIIGSIGVMKLHVERSKQMEKDGVTATVIRSGQYKLLENSVEPLSAQAKDAAEKQAADVHALFRAQVAKGRPDLSAEDLAEVTQGQTFLGKRALTAGLIDKVGSFDQALKLLDNQKHSRDTSSNSKGKAMKVSLTPEQYAALQAGATLASLGVTAEVETPEVPAVPAVVDAPAATQAAAVEAPAAAAAAAAEPTALSLLTTQLSAAQTELIATKAQLMNLEASTKAQKDSFDGLLAIARQSVGKLSIAMGGNDTLAAGMDAAAAIAEHERLNAAFLVKYKPGQQSAAVKVDQPVKSQLPPGFAAACKSAPSA